MLRLIKENFPLRRRIRKKKNKQKGTNGWFRCTVIRGYDECKIENYVLLQSIKIDQ